MTVHADLPTWEAMVSRRFAELKSQFPSDMNPVDARLDAVRSSFLNWDNKLVLDLGSGRGRYGPYLSQWGARPLAYDISAEFMGDLPTHDLKITGSAHRLPFADSQFDAVLMAETIQHFHSPEIALREASRVVKPNGRLIIIERNPFALNANRWWIPAILMKWLDQQRGYWMYSKDSPVCERWYSVKGIRHMISKSNTDYRWSLQYLASKEEPSRWVHENAHFFRSFYCLTGRRVSADDGSGSELSRQRAS